YRLLSVINKYSSTERGFPTYMILTFRFFALSLRRKEAISWDRDCVVSEDAWNNDTEYELPVPLEPQARQRSLLPDSTAVSCTAIKKRILYMCVKCAHQLSDMFITRLASAMDIDIDMLMRYVQEARKLCCMNSRHHMAFRRGRDAAWLRMRVCERRIKRSSDPELKEELLPKLERDRRLYNTAVMSLRSARASITNREVARIVGVSKSTVDSGINRILRQCGMIPKCAKSTLQYPLPGGVHGTAGSYQQRAQTRGTACGHARSRPTRAKSAGPVL
ncbi:MAG TPA: hypothetical protein PLC54_08450, partial [Spirochaetales bacterium]|nr:hypothetical protein [Spirochaetales bacterium]